MTSQIFPTKNLILSHIACPHDFLGSRCNSLGIFHACKSDPCGWHCHILLLSGDITYPLLHSGLCSFVAKLRETLSQVIIFNEGNPWELFSVESFASQMNLLFCKLKSWMKSCPQGTFRLISVRSETFISNLLISLTITDCLSIPSFSTTLC